MFPVRFRLFSLALVLGLVQIACSGGSPAPSNEQPNTVTATEAADLPRSRGIANLAVPFEGVVQIWAGYYDQAGEFQIGWTGSGTIITPDGLILTNAHVVLPDRYFAVDELIVALTVNQDQEPQPAFFAEVLQADEALDLAVIRVTHDYDGVAVEYSALDLPYVSLGDADSLNLGDELTILGYPGIGGETVTLTRGAVSGFTSEQPYGARAFIKTNATIAGGNSGGLAVDTEGYLVGVPTQLGYGGDDQFVDCRVLVDTNRDGVVDDMDNCVPTGGFINALRPVTLALPLIQAAQRGEFNISGGSAQPVSSSGGSSFVDDFSDANSGWDVYSYESGSAYYFGGEFYLEDVEGSPYYVSLLHQTHANVEISADLRIVENEGDENEFSLSCRYVDADNGYEFRIFADGWVGISKWLGGEYISLSDPAPAVDPLEGRSARITAVCDGERLTLLVDGEQVAEASDDSFSTGNIGIAAYAAVGERFVVAVDNFSATSLSASQAGDWEQIYFDDFSSTSTGWNESNDQEFARYYLNGRYYMEVMPTESYSLSVQSGSIEDVVLNVDVNIEQPSHQGDVGLLCRYIDADNYYALEVSEDGYYSIWKMVDGEFNELVKWTTSSLIPTDSEPFALNASCEGAQLSLGINGELLATTTDTDLTSGRVGLFAGTLDHGGLVVSFDNFEVLAP
ncbi:MAG: trypsin-like peptidase domain-containing protein [Anaerolineales bacterium]|nr:trypsin-like peptidase domain-containing protein [Anaerolineales bacterium]MCW5855455.1 trypsin-like peptidase domain-containing protein [Anaerolineales bacterium]